MRKRGKQVIVLMLYLCFAILLVTFLYYQDPQIQEKKITGFLYRDQPIEAIRQIKILLFFHPSNQYGQRVLSLLTSDAIHYP